MRILLITSSYHPQQGGLQQVVGRLAEGLLARHMAVSVITNQFPVSLPLHEVINGVDVWRFPYFAPDWVDFRQGRPGLYFACYFISIWTLLGFLWRMLRFRPDVVNIHFPVNQSPFFNLIKTFFPKVKVIVSLHGNDVEQYLSDDIQFRQDVRRQTEKALQRLIEKSDLVTTVSTYLLAQAEQFNPLVAGKGIVIPNGFDPLLDPIHNKPDRDRPFILGVGRLTYRKGFDLLVGAFTRIASDYPQVDLVLIGEGEMRTTLQEVVRSYDLASRVKFLGWLPHDQVLAWMEQSRFVVVPSRQEGFGMAALEAMAAGKPVVSTRAGALPELLSDAGNLLVETSELGLAEGMVKLLENPDLSSEIGSRNRVFSQKYAWDKIVDTYIQAYERVLDQV